MKDNDHMADVLVNYDEMTAEHNKVKQAACADAMFTRVRKCQSIGLEEVFILFIIAFSVLLPHAAHAEE